MQVNTSTNVKGHESKRSPTRCWGSERPALAAYAAAHEFGYTRAEHTRDLIAGLRHSIEEARCGAGGLQS